MILSRNRRRYVELVETGLAAQLGRADAWPSAAHVDTGLVLPLEMQIANGGSSVFHSTRPWPASAGTHARGAEIRPSPRSMQAAYLVAQRCRRIEPTLERLRTSLTHLFSKQKLWPVSVGLCHTTIGQTARIKLRSRRKLLRR